MTLGRGGSKRLAQITIIAGDTQKGWNFTFATTTYGGGGGVKPYFAPEFCGPLPWEPALFLGR